MGKNLVDFRRTFIRYRLLATVKLTLIMRYDMLYQHSLSWFVFALPKKPTRGGVAMLGYIHEK